MEENDEDEELEYANELEYHTPPVVCDLRLIESPPMSLGEIAYVDEGECDCPCPGIGWRSGRVSPMSSSEEPPVENDVPIPIQIEHSSLLNLVRGQPVLRSLRPIQSQPSIFHPRHPYKTSGDHQGWNILLTDLWKCYFWRKWARTPGNPYGRFVGGSSDSESSGGSPHEQQEAAEGGGVIGSLGVRDRVD